MDELNLNSIENLHSLFNTPPNLRTQNQLEQIMYFTKENKFLKKICEEHNSDRIFWECCRVLTLEIYEKNNRPELAQTEREEIEVIRKYLPAMLEGAELEAIIKRIIAETGAESARDMGKVMGAANKELAGKAEGRAISELVKQLLS